MIFVDELREWYGKKWCHMMTDGDLIELHQFVRSVGFSPRFHNGYHPHYDLGTRNRKKAIIAGAVSVTGKELLRRCRK